MAWGPVGASGSGTGESDLCERVADEVRRLQSERLVGRVANVRGLSVGAAGLPVSIGARCTVHTRAGEAIDAEVVGLSPREASLSILGETSGISPGDEVECRAGRPLAPVGFDLLGRVIGSQGEPIDDKPRPWLNLRYPLSPDAPAALERVPIDEPLGLGVRAIDAMLTAGRGQRLGIFAGTGVGKSVLMGMICRHTQADVNVIALVGERGREVLDFVQHQLGPEGLERSVVVVCTSDAAPALRVRSCLHATAIAEYFRDSGMNVLLMMDSLTRMAMAQRQLGLAAGEPPTSKGYPPSVYSMLPRLVERAGRTKSGSITAIYTVLVEGDDIDEPLADAVRGLLDGHIWLSRPLANRGHYPAIDILGSISRVADDVRDEGHRKAAMSVRRVLATWREIEDLVNIGAYVRGANAEYDLAVQMRERVQAFLTQQRDERCSYEQSVSALMELAKAIEHARPKGAPPEPRP